MAQGDLAAGPNPVAIVVGYGILLVLFHVWLMCCNYNTGIDLLSVPCFFGFNLNDVYWASHILLVFYVVICAGSLAAVNRYKVGCQRKEWGKFLFVFALLTGFLVYQYETTRWLVLPKEIAEFRFKEFPSHQPWRWYSLPATELCRPIPLGKEYQFKLENINSDYRCNRGQPLDREVIHAWSSGFRVMHVEMLAVSCGGFTQTEYLRWPQGSRLSDQDFADSVEESAEVGALAGDSSVETDVVFSIPKNAPATLFIYLVNLFCGKKIGKNSFDIECNYDLAKRFPEKIKEVHWEYIYPKGRLTINHFQSVEPSDTILIDIVKSQVDGIVWLIEGIKFNPLKQLSIVGRKLEELSGQRSIQSVKISIWSEMKFDELFSLIVVCKKAGIAKFNFMSSLPVDHDDYENIEEEAILEDVPVETPKRRQ